MYNRFYKLYIFISYYSFKKIFTIVSHYITSFNNSKNYYHKDYIYLGKLYDYAVNKMFACSESLVNTR